MPGKVIPLVMMFVSVRGSSELYELLDTHTAMGVVERCLGQVKEVARTHQGAPIKTIGSEVMFTFTKAEAAARAAMEMQSRVDEQCTGGEFHPASLGLSIGVHSGPVIREPGDVFGDAVNITARIMAMGKPGQILLTRQISGQLPEELSPRVRYFDNVGLRGKAERVDLYELIWEQSGVTDRNQTRPPRSVVSGAEANRKLRLRHDWGELVIDEHAPLVHIGRAAANDITVPNIMASRRHATIEYRNGRFLLTDESINGTFVVTEDGESVTVRRENYVLKGSGMISLGMPPSTIPELVVYYACE